MDKESQVKVLIVDNSYGITGALKSILTVSKAIDSVSFYFLSPSKENVSYLEQQGIKAQFIPFKEIRKNWKLIFYPFILMLNSIRIVRILKRNKIPIIHVNDLYNMVGVVVKILYPSIKLVYHIRLLPDSYAGSLYKVWSFLILRFANKVITVSNSVYENFINHPDKVVIIHDSIRKLEKETIERDIKKNSFVCLFPANFTDGKGHIYAIEALKEVINKNTNIKLRFIGGCTNKKSLLYKKYLEQRVQELGLNDNIEFVSFAESIEDEMIDSDLILMFSDSESFSMVCLEAGMCGKAVIATKCGGPEDIIENGKTGILVEKRAINQMSEQIIRLINNDSLRNRLGAKAQELCKSKFSLDRSSQALNKLYRSMQ